MIYQASLISTEILTHKMGILWLIFILTVKK